MIWAHAPSFKTMFRVGVDCRYTSYLPNERDLTIGANFLLVHYKEDVLYVDIRQLGEVASVKMMKIWEKQF